MFSLYIDKNCIACDACRDVCPTEAISIGEVVYTIQPNLCVLCVGYRDNPHCIDVCPVDAILEIPQNTKN